MSNKKSSPVVNSNSSRENSKYVVLRNGHRVSDAEYENFESAKEEYNYWKRIIERWPDGSKIEISEKK